MGRDEGRCKEHVMLVRLPLTARTTQSTERYAALHNSLCVSLSVSLCLSLSLSVSCSLSLRLCVYLDWLGSHN